MERLRILVKGTETPRAGGMICLTETRLPGAAESVEPPGAEGRAAGNGIQVQRSGEQLLIWTAGPLCPEDGTPAPEKLTERYGACLSAAAEAGIETADILTIPTGVYDSRLFQTATAILRAVRSCLLTQEMPGQIRILCGTEREVTVYKQAYNFWFADTKSVRMKDAGWD